MLDTKQPIISVVIPLFNKECSIERAINSVLMQTVPFQELIIINDGSTDNSLTIAEQFIDARIKIITQQNQGVSTARNNGVAIAKQADYVCFLDADDEWYPHFLEEIIGLIELNPQAGIFCARYEEVDEQNNLFVGKLVNISDNFYGQLQDFFLSYKVNRSLICSSNICVNVKQFNLLGGFPTQARIGEDIYLWLNMALKSPVMFSSKISARVYRNAENRTYVRERVITPFHLVYFLDQKQQSLLAKNQSLRAFILYNATVFCLYASLNGEKKKAFSIVRTLAKYRLFYSCLLLIIIMMPKSCINFLKKIRNKKTLTYERKN